MKKLILIPAIAFGLVACGGGGGGSTAPVASSAASSAAVSSSSSSAASSVSSSSSSAVASNWELIWNDEFDGASVDTSKWSFEKNCMGGGNNELQCYTDRTDNAYVSGGNLHIVAKKEAFSGPAKQDDDPTYNAADTSAARDYTSARLRTKLKGDWTYGRMEIRAKLPQGQGMWPAIWMLPTEWKYGNWPSSGEIDIMEAVNSNTGSNGSKVYGTLHYGTPWKYTNTSYAPSDNIWDNYHTYTVEWEQGTIRWYVDHKHFATQTQNGWYTNGSTAPAAPFDQKFHLILNLAVGGNWPGSPNNATVFPGEMTVDYVRVYRCSLDPVTGKGCASDVDPNLAPLPGNPKPTANFAQPPLFNLYGDSLAAGLDVGSYNPNGTISSAELAESGRGKVFNVVKTGGAGNVYFTIPSGAVDLSSWSANGQLSFDVKVNSMADGAKLLVKMDSGYPNVSDTQVTLPAIGSWGHYSIAVSDLIAKGNSIDSGIANLAAISNIFVIEPNAAMDVSFDNIQLATP